MNLCSGCPQEGYPTDKTRCSPCPRRATTWKIRIAGYGTFDFEGTEAQAEEMRRHKCQWEQGFGHKWRADLSCKSDKIMAEMAALADSGKGIPAELFDRRRDALKAERGQ